MGHRLQRPIAGTSLGQCALVVSGHNFDELGQQRLPVVQNAGRCSAAGLLLVLLQQAVARNATILRAGYEFGVASRDVALGGQLLTIQGDGDYDAAKQLTDRMGNVDATLAGDLKRLDKAKIPVDVTFEQGLDVLGLTKP